MCGVFVFVQVVRVYDCQCMWQCGGIFVVVDDDYVDFCVVGGVECVECLCVVIDCDDQCCVFACQLYQCFA